MALQGHKLASARFHSEPRQPPPRPPPPRFSESPRKTTTLATQTSIPEAAETSTQTSKTNDSFDLLVQSPSYLPPPPQRVFVDLNRPLRILEQSPEPAGIVVEVPYIAPKFPCTDSHQAVMDVSVNLKRRGDHQKIDHVWPISVINMQMSQYLSDENSVRMVCEETESGNDTDTTSALLKGNVHIYRPIEEESDVLSAFSEDSPIPTVKFGYPAKCLSPMEGGLATIREVTPPQRPKPPPVPPKPAGKATVTPETLQVALRPESLPIPPKTGETSILPPKSSEPPPRPEAPPRPSASPKSPIPAEALKPPRPPPPQKPTLLQIPEPDDETSISSSTNVPILYPNTQRKSSVTSQDYKETAIISDDDDSSILQRITNVKNSMSELFDIHKKRRNFRVTAMVYPEQHAEAEATIGEGAEFTVDVEKISEHGRESVLIFDEEYLTSEASIGVDEDEFFIPNRGYLEEGTIDVYAALPEAYGAQLAAYGGQPPGVYAKPKAIR